MNRVDYQHPCPICQHTDGCLYAADGTAAICSRIDIGSVKLVGDGPFSGGWLHIINDGAFTPKPVKNKRPISINWITLNKCYTNTLDPIIGTPFLVSCFDSLKKMDTGWDGEAYTFPVRDDKDQIIGIQRRFPDGSKSMVKGSANGIVIPRLDWTNLNVLFICEGVSDTATAVDFGFKVIGRLNCGTGKDHIIKFCIKKLPNQIVIVADNDEAGLKGAKSLGLSISQGYKLFVVPQPEILVAVPPNNAKDLREYREKGGTGENLLETFKNLLDF